MFIYKNQPYTKDDLERSRLAQNYSGTLDQFIQMYKDDGMEEVNQKDDYYSDKEFSFGNIKNIVGAEETNIGGHKLFQEALKGLDTTQERAAADIADEVDKVMGQVESFLQKNFQQALNIQEINKLADKIW